MATEIIKELTDVYGDSALSYRTVTKRVAEFNDSTRAFKDAPRNGWIPIALINESIRAVHKRS